MFIKVAVLYLVLAILQQEESPSFMTRMHRKLPLWYFTFYLFCCNWPFRFEYSPLLHLLPSLTCHWSSSSILLSFCFGFLSELTLFLLILASKLVESHIFCSSCYISYILKEKSFLWQSSCDFYKINRFKSWKTSSLLLPKLLENSFIMRNEFVFSWFHAAKFRFVGSRKPLFNAWYLLIVTCCVQEY